MKLRAWGREERGRGGGNGEEHEGFLKEARLGRFLAFMTGIEEGAFLPRHEHRREGAVMRKEMTGGSHLS